MDAVVRKQLDAIPGGLDPEAPAHSPGTSVALRSIREFPDRSPAVSFAVAGTVLQDDEELAVVMTRPGSDRAARAGRRIGPRGRNVVAKGWDGSYSLATWEGATVVRVHPRGHCWSLWRWHDGEDWTGGWYGNLEAPWRRTSIGFDTQDWALDVVAQGTPGPTPLRVGLKDEDELAWYIEQGVISPELAAHTRALGDELCEILLRGEGLVAADWSRWAPPSDGEPTTLPSEWRVLPL
ncbi:DUF402 domain-containing protein [Brachybacterium sp. YJGR34]|uniref:DUF402 domain-containing protein n=1 Tax=Brachybacterium sp. YJGR34 TaxID=2059911 RepID=UPI000E0A03BC|nr:DUF402 domain-containing protein [Brachybacterium sp. YJGR34]